MLVSIETLTYMIISGNLIMIMNLIPCMLKYAETPLVFLEMSHALKKCWPVIGFKSTNEWTRILVCKLRWKSGFEWQNRRKVYRKIRCNDKMHSGTKHWTSQLNGKMVKVAEGNGYEKRRILVKTKSAHKMNNRIKKEKK